MTRSKSTASAFAALVTLLLTTGCPQSSRSGTKLSTDLTVASADLSLADQGGRGVVLFATEDVRGSGRGKLFKIDYDSHANVFQYPELDFDEQASYAPRIVLSGGRLDHAMWLVNVRSSERLDEGHVYARTYNRVGEPTSTVELDPGPVAPGEFDLAADDGGNAIGVWQSSGSIVVSRSRLGSPFQAGEPIFTAVGDVVASRPRVVMNAAGSGVIVYAVDDGSGAHSVIAHRVEPDLLIAAGEKLDLAIDSTLPAPAVALDGTLLVTWRQRVAAGEEIVARRGTASGGFAPEEVVASRRFPVDDLGAAFDAASTVTIAWREAFQRRFSRSVAGGAFSLPTDTGLPGDLLAPFEFAVEPAGRVTFAERADSEEDVAGVRFSELQGAGPIRVLIDENSSDSVDDLDVAADGNGTLAVWVLSHALYFHAWRAPSAAFVGRPDRPVVDEPVTLDSSPSHANSTSAGLAASEWDFDLDGVFELQGATVTHSFAIEGSNSFRLRVTDEWGDIDEESFSVDVKPGGGGGGLPWTLTVTVTGAGRVMSSDPGIDCPTDCDERYAEDTLVELTPTADPGFKFDHWEGDLGIDPLDVDLGIEGCQFHMHSDRTITAVFVASS